MFPPLCCSHVKETDSAQGVAKLEAPAKKDDEGAVKKTGKKKRNEPHIPTASCDQAVLRKPAKKDDRSVHNGCHII